MTAAFRTIRELGADLRTGRLSAVALAETCLERLQTVGRRLNAVVTLTDPQAADGYDVWYVSDKTLVPARMGGSSVSGVAGCTPTSRTTCDDGGALLRPLPSFYNVVGVCNGTEGP